MENSDSHVSSMSVEEKTVNSNAELINRLKNWVKERGFKKRERDVRENVANAITTDILHPLGVIGIPDRLGKYRDDVNGGLSTAISKLGDLPKKENGVVAESSEQEDKNTGVKFITRIKRDGDFWVSEEVGTVDNKIISQAKIGDKGELSLTLNFSDPRYEERGANPKLEDATGFPTGTKVLFLNHAASLGVISWKGR